MPPALQGQNPYHRTTPEVPSSACLDSQLAGGPPLCRCILACTASPNLPLCSLVLSTPSEFLQNAPRCIKQVWSERDDSLPNLLAVLYSPALLISLPPTQLPSQESWQFDLTLFFPFVLPVLLFPPYPHPSPFIFSLPVFSPIYHQAALRLKRLPAELPS